MKVLWFTNSPSLASGYLSIKTNGLGWIESLEKEMSKIEGLELGVAFPFGYDDEKRFEIGSTKYFSYPYPLEKKGVKGLFERWMHRIEPETVTKFYLEIVNEFQPELIHIFGTESPAGLIIPLVKVPVIIQIQGNLSVCVKKWFAGLSNIEILKNSDVRKIVEAYGLWHMFYLFKKRAERERKLMLNCKYYIGRTDWDRRVSKILSPKSSYFHCDELLREEFYHANRWSKPVSGKIIIISTINTMVYKGLETILETAWLLKQNQTFDFDWDIAGVNGAEEIIGILEKSYKRKFRESNIVFKGSLGPGKLLSELHQSNLYVHPSHIENSPNSLCEAMLIGMPIIATYAGGTSSLVSNGLDGILVQDGDPYSLAGAIIELIHNRFLIHEISENAHKRALGRHDKEQVTCKMTEIYKQVIDE